MLPALLHFALARHLREDAAALGTMFLLLGEAVVAQAVVPQAVGSPSGGSLQLRGHRPLLLGGSVLRRRPATRTRVSKYRSSATQHFGCDAMRCAAAGSWEVGFPRAELSSLFVALAQAPSDLLSPPRLKAPFCHYLLLHFTPLKARN